MRIPPTAEQHEYLDEFVHQLEIMDLMIEKTLTRIAMHPERESAQNRKATFFYEGAADNIHNALATVKPLYQHYKPRHVQYARTLLKTAVANTVKGTTS